MNRLYAPHKDPELGESSSRQAGAQSMLPDSATNSSRARPVGGPRKLPQAPVHARKGIDVANTAIEDVALAVAAFLKE